jgi:hypothetical protein
VRKLGLARKKSARKLGFARKKNVRKLGLARKKSARKLESWPGIARLRALKDN